MHPRKKPAALPSPPHVILEDRPLDPDPGDDWPRELDDEALDALLPDADYEPLPEDGDFWIDHDAA